MIEKPFIDQLTDTLLHALPSHMGNMKQDVRANVQVLLRGVLDKLEVVTREEFDAQKKVLARTRQKVEALEAVVKKLEQSLDS